MANFRIRQKSADKILQNLAKFDKDFRAKAILAMQNVMLDLVREIQIEILQDKAVDTGLLLASIQEIVTTPSADTIMGTAFSDKEYAGVIEFGRRPGSKPPPLRVLIPWAGRHGITTSIPKLADPTKEPYASALKTARIMHKKSTGNKSAFGQNLKGKAKKNADRIRDFLILIAIQEAIGKRGIKGRYPMTNALQRKQKTLKIDLVKYLTLQK